MGRHSTSQAIRKMQIKTTMRYLLEWLLSRKVITRVGEVVEKKGTLIHCWWELKLVQPLWKTV